MLRVPSGAGSFPSSQGHGHEKRMEVASNTKDGRFWPATIPVDEVDGTGAKWAGLLGVDWHQSGAVRLLISTSRQRLHVEWMQVPEYSLRG